LCRPNLTRAGSEKIGAWQSRGGKSSLDVDGMARYAKHGTAMM